MTRKEQILKAAEFDRKKSATYMQNNHEFLASGSDMDAAELENSRLKPLHIAMADRIEQLEKALEYYGDWRNYSVDYDTSNNGFSRRCILYGDIEQRNESIGLAGERARQALTTPTALDAILKWG